MYSNECKVLLVGMYCVEYTLQECTVQSTPCRNLLCRVDLVGMYCVEYTQQECTMQSSPCINVLCNVGIYCVLLQCVLYTVYSSPILMFILSLELTRVNLDRNIFSINVELTSFFLNRGLVHHHRRILNDKDKVLVCSLEFLLLIINNNLLVKQVNNIYCRLDRRGLRYCVKHWQSSKTMIQVKRGVGRGVSNIGRVPRL